MQSHGKGQHQTLVKYPDLGEAAACSANACITGQATVSVPLVPITGSPDEQGIDWLDRSAVGYLVLPLVIFLAGWCQLWVSIPLIICVGFSLAPLVWGKSSSAGPRVSVGVALISFATAAIWAYLGGIGHFRFANPDWLFRDAVLRDLVVSPWPVGYGELQGQDTLLRTTVAYFLPVAALGKLLGLQATQVLLLVWTTLGAGLFFLQVISLLPRGKNAILTALLVLMFFSGMDVIGNLLNGGEYFISQWRIESFLGLWTDYYHHYSSMTTQLFWVPNHALGGWLSVGLLLRNNKVIYGVLPIALVSLILWSPFAAAGVAPFVLWRYATNIWSGWSPRALLPRAWIGALLVAIPVVGYVTLDLGGIPRSIVSLTPMSLAALLQFFFLEVGIVGWIVYALRPSPLPIIALIVLLVLPLVNFGEGNDLETRASMPSLAVLAIAVCMELTAPAASARAKRLRRILIAFLFVGAVTPAHEIARSFVLPRWDPHVAVTLVGASCGEYYPHYIAKLDKSPVRHLLRTVNMLPPGAQRPKICVSPCIDVTDWGRCLN